MKTIRKFRPWRRLVQFIHASLIVGIPFVKIDGESALRFDVPSLTLYFFGSRIWMDEFFIVLLALLFLTFLIVTITQLFGRIWCGWSCPQTVLTDFTGFIENLHRKGIAKKAASYVAVFTLSLLVGASLVWYFVSPYEFLGSLIKGSMGPVAKWSWLALAMIVFLDLVLVRKRFCATVCPYAKLQSVLFDRKTLVIGFDESRKQECMDCQACVRACPLGIDIREGLNSACIACAECVDTCGIMTSRTGRNSLIGYFFGDTDTKSGLFRINVLVTGLVTLFFLSYFIYVSSSRRPLSMTVLPDSAFSPRLAEDGKVVNTFILSFENRGRTDSTVLISADAQGERLKVTPDEAKVASGEHRNVRVFVMTAEPGKALGQETIEIIAFTKDGHETELREKVKLVYGDSR